MSARRVRFSRRRPTGPMSALRRPQPRHLARRAQLRLRHARTEVLGGIAVVTAAILAIGVAFAYYTGSGSATATATAGTLNPPTNVSATQVANSTNVTVSWSAPTGPVAPTGYYVTRTPNGGSDAAACATSATTTITALTCTDTSVEAGSYTYRVVAVFRSWTASSAPASITVAPVIAPVISITHPGPAPAAGYFSLWNIGCNGNADRVCADVTSGAANLTVQANSVRLVIKRASDNRCYDGTGTNASTDWSDQACLSPLPMTLDTEPRYRSNNLFAQNAAVNGTLTFTVSATNSAGVSASASVTRTFDSAPTATISPANGGYTSTGQVTISATDVNGIASISYRVNANDPTAFTTVAGPGPVSFSVPVGINTVDYYATDTVGQRSTQVNNSQVIYDNTAPTVANLVPSGAGGATWLDVDCTLGGNPDPNRRICATVSDDGVIANVYWELKRASDGACYDGVGDDPITDWSTNNCGSTAPAYVATLNGGTYRSPRLLSDAYNDEDAYTARVFARDLAGNIGSRSGTFFIGTGPSLTGLLPASGGSYRVSGTGGTQWSGVCSTGRVCANVTDTSSSVASVTYQLYRINGGGGSAWCWNGSNFVNNNFCAEIPMTLGTGSQYVGNPIASSAINAVLSGNSDNRWRVLITATDTLGFVTTALQSFTFNRSTN